MGKGSGHLPPANFVKCFCALAITVKRTGKKTIIYALFSQFLEGSHDSFSSLGVHFEGEKVVHFLEEKK